MCSDAELLRRYADAHDERAFAELVERHLPLVYAAACRRVGGRAALAEEVAQHVFCDLARRSRALVAHTSLIGWLYRSTRYASIDALRVERRRAELAVRAAALAEAPATRESLDWERLRPLIDAAVDGLKATDREVVLMRYFYSLSFGEIGSRLGLSENAARMRAERSLDKLKSLLARRGLTSTSAALAAALGTEACAAVPRGIAVGVTQAAVAFAPSTATLAATGVLMGKLTVPALSGLIAAGLTAVIWTASTGSSRAAIEALRAEHARLVAADVPAADAAAVATVVDDYARQATAIATGLQRRQSQRGVIRGGAPAAAHEGGGAPAVTARGHRDHGIATPEDAVMTFAWACDIADPDELAEIITFDPDGRAAASEVFAAMPEGIRRLYPTPEAVVGMLLAASCLEAPPPGADIIQRNMMVVDLAPGRIATRRQGSTRNMHEYLRTDAGWKYIVPVEGVRNLPALLTSETLARLSEP